ncbi:MAG: signal peptide peptidase SppA [Pseudomonadota bacterium]
MNDSIPPKAIFPIILLLLVLSISGCATPKINLFAFGTEPLQEFTLEGDGKQKILVIQVKGIIWDERKEGFILSGPSMLQEIVSQLRKAEADTNIKALILKIDSPGGTVTASDIIYHELMRFKEKTGIKIVAVMMDLAASGGYYISLPADYIVAHPTTVTGSVGVLFPRWQAYGLMEKIGVRRDVSKSGKHKDMGSPFREPTREEIKIFQGLIDGLNNRFIALVKKHRNLSPEALEEVSTARVFLADDAFQIGLIDEVGYLNDAIEQSKKMTNLLKDAKIITYRRVEQPDDNLYNTATTQLGTRPLSLIDLGLPREMMPILQNRFCYIWEPGISD